MLYAIFISLFALDVFEEGKAFWETSSDLLVHLIPSFLLVAFLAISWRREWIAGSIFILSGAAYMIMNLDHKQWILAISGPLFLIGTLFLLDWNRRKSKDTTTKTESA